MKASAVRRRRKAFVTPERHVAFYAGNYPGVFDPDTHYALFALRAVAQLVNDSSNEWLSQLGLTVGKYGYLVTLESAPGHRLTFNELSRWIHTTNATVTTMIQSLERDGLVRRVPNPEDRRSVLAELTPKGSRLVKRAIVLHHENIERALRAFSMEKRRDLFRLLVELGEAFEEDAAASARSRSNAWSGSSAT
jgi:DNA-binding MarR family transcriptional regulator